MNKNTKFTNPMKVITGPDTRWSYANVWEPKSINGGAPKYSVSLIIPKSDTKAVAKIQAAIEAAYREGESKLKGNGKSVPALSAIKTPLRDGDRLDADKSFFTKCGNVLLNGVCAHTDCPADSSVTGMTLISFAVFAVEQVGVSAPTGVPRPGLWAQGVTPAGPSA